MPVEQRRTSGRHQTTVATDCTFCGEDIPEGTGYAEHLAFDCSASPAIDTDEGSFGRPRLSVPTPEFRRRIASHLGEDPERYHDHSIRFDVAALDAILDALNVESCAENRRERRDEVREALGLEREAQTCLARPTLQALYDELGRPGDDEDARGGGSQ